MPSLLQCGRWRQGHTSLERKHDYDTDRNEVYGFVDIVIDEAGCRRELFQTEFSHGLCGYRVGGAGS